MQVEELLQLLRDAGLDDEGVKKLLGDALASLEGPAEEEHKEIVEENEEEKMNRVFGL